MWKYIISFSVLGGKVSDKVRTQESNFLRHLDDVVLADRGFTFAYTYDM